MQVAATLCIFHYKMIIIIKKMDRTYAMKIWWDLCTILIVYLFNIIDVNIFSINFIEIKFWFRVIKAVCIFFNKRVPDHFAEKAKGTWATGSWQIVIPRSQSPLLRERLARQSQIHNSNSTKQQVRVHQGIGARARANKLQQLAVLLSACTGQLKNQGMFGCVC